MDLANRLAAAEAGQGLLRELWCGRATSLSSPTPGMPKIAIGNTTAVAAMAVNSIDGSGRRHDTDRCYVCVSCYQCFDTAREPTNLRAGS